MRKGTVMKTSIYILFIFHFFLSKFFLWLLSQMHFTFSHTHVKRFITTCKWFKQPINLQKKWTANPWKRGLSKKKPFYNKSDLGMCRMSVCVRACVSLSVYVFQLWRPSDTTCFLLLQGCIFFTNSPPPGGGEINSGVRGRKWRWISRTFDANSLFGQGLKKNIKNILKIEFFFSFLSNWRRGIISSAKEGKKFAHRSEYSSP